MHCILPKKQGILYLINVIEMYIANSKKGIDQKNGKINIELLHEEKVT